MNNKERELLQNAAIALEFFKGSMNRDLFRKEIEPLVSEIREYLIEYELKLIKEKTERKKKDPLDIDTVPQPLLQTHVENRWRDTKS